MTNIGTQFKFELGHGYNNTYNSTYTATKVDNDQWHVTWATMRAGGVNYPNQQVIDAVQTGGWKVLEVISPQPVATPSQIERLTALARKGVAVTFRVDGTLVLESVQWQFRTNDPEYFERIIERAEALVA